MGQAQIVSDQLQVEASCIRRATAKVDQKVDSSSGCLAVMLCAESPEAKRTWMSELADVLTLGTLKDQDAEAERKVVVSCLKVGKRVLVEALDWTKELAAVVSAEEYHVVVLLLRSRMLACQDVLALEVIKLVERGNAIEVPEKANVQEQQSKALAESAVMRKSRHREAARPRLGMTVSSISIKAEVEVVGRRRNDSDAL